jgi:hypothetical protein
MNRSDTSGRFKTFDGYTRIWKERNTEICEKLEVDNVIKEVTSCRKR